jgi:hypothetical protein
MAQKEFTFIPPETEVVFNVGGQIFETTAGVLTKDPYSVLAAYCRVSENALGSPRRDSATESAVSQSGTLFEAESSSGIFFIDRDWWLFRHIITYLRSNVLPNEYETLKELYVEAAFYRLESLQTAIENLPMEQVSNISSQIQKTYPGHASAADATSSGLSAGGERKLNTQNARIFDRVAFAGSV